MLIEMTLEYSPYIDGPPVTKDQQWQQCTGNDTVTTTTWGTIWHDNTAKNKETYDFDALSAFKKFSQAEKYRPVIVAGSGPSLKRNYMDLLPKTKTNQLGDEVSKGGRGNIPIVSCLHNYSFFEDNGLMQKSDYYITLDAGPITIKEITEGGKNTDDWYWDRTKDRTLIAHHTTDPELLEKWQGEVYFYTDQAQQPDTLVGTLDPAVCIPFTVGGCVAGAATYFAEAVLGASQVIFMGMDFSFSYEKKFHAWDSSYDNKFSGVIPCTDVYGNRVYTWPSYHNFKSWFEFHACGGNGNNFHNWVNCSQGGILGSYPMGNIKQIPQMDLKDVLGRLVRHEDMSYWAGKKVILW